MPWPATVTVLTGLLSTSSRLMLPPVGIGMVTVCGAVPAPVDVAVAGVGAAGRLMWAVKVDVAVVLSG